MLTVMTDRWTRAFLRDGDRVKNTYGLDVVDCCLCRCCNPKLSRQPNAIFASSWRVRSRQMCWGYRVMHDTPHIQCNKALLTIAQPHAFKVCYSVYLHSFKNTIVDLLISNVIQSLDSCRQTTTTWQPQSASFPLTMVP